jgi:hypothetical protein
MTLKAIHEPSNCGFRGAEVHQWCTKLKIFGHLSLLWHRGSGQTQSYCLLPGRQQAVLKTSAWITQNCSASELQFLLFLSIPLFISGIIKYGEKTWVLTCSTTKQILETFTQQLLWRNQGANILLLVNNLHQAAYSKFVEVELGFMYDMLYVH